MKLRPAMFLAGVAWAVLFTMIVLWFLNLAPFNGRHVGLGVFTFIVALFASAIVSN